MVNIISNGNIKEPVLITFPRSGTNWTRYCIEYFSEKPTPGKKRIYKQDKGTSVIYRTHDIKNINPVCIKNGKNKPKNFFKSINESNFSKIILIIRNPLDNYVSFNKNYDKLKNFFNNISVYDNFDGEKIIKYYEDITSDDFNHMLEIIKFIGIDYESKIKNFIEKLQYHKEESIKMYNNNWDNRTRGNRKILSTNEKKIILNIIKKEYTYITKKYLYRYI